MLIYLRHGDDRGNDVYRHDRHLNDHGRHKAHEKTRRLISRRGHPDMVFVSPFRRSLETLEAMATRFHRSVEIHRDPRIAQYLSAKQRIAPRISPETLAVITIDEDERAFRHRVSDHIEDARSRASTSSVWCVTHQVVIEEVGRHFGVKISTNLDFLDHLVVLK
jgi:broad specificity phosphatase PhoE